MEYELLEGKEWKDLYLVLHGSDSLKEDMRIASSKYGCSVFVWYFQEWFRLDDVDIEAFFNGIREQCEEISKLEFLVKMKKAHDSGYPLGVVESVA